MTHTSFDCIFCLGCGDVPTDRHQLPFEIVSLRHKLDSEIGRSLVICSAVWPWVSVKKAAKISRSLVCSSAVCPKLGLGLG